jgi:hypothetical protein
MAAWVKVKSWAECRTGNVTVNLCTEIPLR